MQTPSASGGPRRSAFAAAFFSFLFPGLGQAYLGRWVRALGWAALPILVIALLAGMMVNHSTRVALVSELADPTVVLALIVGIVADMLYRLASMLDAWRLARVAGSPDDVPSRRFGSAVGFVAVVTVLIVSHAGVAGPAYGWYQYLNEGFGGGGEPEPSGPLDPSFASGIIAPSFSTGPSLAPGETATPTPKPSPTPTKGPDWNGGPLNILLIGADGGRAGYSGYLTDTMITVMIDPASKQVAFVSLPRDTAFVPLPRAWPAYRAYGGAFPTKINALYTYAKTLYPDLFPVGDDRTRGYEALKGTLGELYDIKIDYYVAVDLNSFRDVVDSAALGGLMVDVQNPVYDSSYPSDDGRGKIKLYIPPGIQYMDGREALSYARARHATSDFDRSARQQRVVTSVREQFDLPSLLAPGRLGELLRIVKKSVRTDIPPKKLPQMVQLAEEIDLDQRISLVLSGSFMRTCYLSPPPCPQNDTYQLVPNVTAIQRAIGRVFKEDKAVRQLRERVQSEEAVVLVLNGTTNSNLKSIRIADHLAERGMDAQVPPINNGAADTSDYTDAVITVYNGAQEDLATTIGVLEKALGVTAVTVDDPAQTADIVVIVGTRTPSLKPEG